MTRQEAFEIIFSKQRGLKKDLEKEITPELYKQFCQMGFISQGITVIRQKGQNTWSITERGIESYNFYHRKPTTKEKELGIHISSFSS